LSEVPTVPDQLDSVTSGAADLSIAGISITSDRSGSVDFSQPYYNSGLQILTVPKSSGVASYLGTLTSKPVVHLAIAVLVLLILVAHIVWLVDRRRPDFPAGYLHGLGHGLWWAATSLANVGYGERKPKSAIGRILTVVWMLVAVLVIADYTATVTSAFTVQNLNSAIGGPDDLPGKRVASVTGSTASSYVESHKLDATLVAAIDDAYRLLADGKVDAVVYDSPVLRYYANTTGKGQAIVVGPVFEPQSYGIAMPVGSVWRRPIDQAILSVMEDGTYARLQQAWFGSAQPG
jgi:ABC-type amino acid transport substrate-binding protein